MVTARFNGSAIGGFLRGRRDALAHGWFDEARCTDPSPWQCRSPLPLVGEQQARAPSTSILSFVDVECTISLRARPRPRQHPEAAGDEICPEWRILGWSCALRPLRVCFSACPDHHQQSPFTRCRIAHTIAFRALRSHGEHTFGACALSRPRR